MKSNLEIKSKKLICTLRCSIRCDFPFRGFRIRVTTRRYDGGSHVLERFRSPTIADANFLRARTIMRDVLQTVTLLTNAPLPHSPGAITAIITGPSIFPARGLHTRRGTEAGGRGARDYSELSNGRSPAAIVHCARAIALVCLSA